GEGVSRLGSRRERPLYWRPPGGLPRLPGRLPACICFEPAPAREIAMKFETFVLLPLLCLLLAEPGQNEKFQQELKQFEGTWKPISMEMDGKFLSDEQIGKTRLTIKGEKFTFDTGRDSHEGLYKINPAVEPKQLDIVI